MEVWAEVGKLRRPPAKFLRDRSRLQTAQPDAQVRDGGAEGFQKVNERLTVPPLHPPGGDLNAGDDDLPVTLRSKLLCLRDGVLQRLGAERPPGIGYDAVGAEVAAAVLDLEHSPGAALQAAGGQHFKPRSADGVVHVDPGLAAADLPADLIEKCLLAARAGDHIHLQGRNLFRLCLGIAPADADDSVRILPPDPADDLAGLLVADGGDRTGVDDVELSLLLKRDGSVALALQNGLHGLAFVLIHFTSKGINRKTHKFVTLSLAFPQAARYNEYLMSHIIAENQRAVYPGKGVSYGK